MTLARLQLAVGNAAVLHDERRPDGPRRIFAARAPDEPVDARPSRLVVWHPPPPDGPHPGALLDRMASIRVIAHPALAAPLATGTIDDAAWIVEPAPASNTLAARLQTGGPLPHHDVVRLLRDVARALAAMHRRGVCHGALDADAITLRGDGVQLYHLGRRLGGTVAGDLAALGALARNAVTADPSRGGPQRVIPDAMHELLDRLNDADTTRRPTSADQLLSALDVFPGTDTGSADTLFDSSGRGAREPGQRRTAMLLAAAAVLLLVAWFLLRSG